MIFTQIKSFAGSRPAYLFHVAWRAVNFYVFSKGGKIISYTKLHPTKIVCGLSDCKITVTNPLYFEINFYSFL